MRRAYIDKMTPAELAILEAMQLVEKMGADDRLSDAVTLLHKAKEAVADFVDKVERRA